LEEPPEIYLPSIAYPSGDTRSGVIHFFIVRGRFWKPHGSYSVRTNGS
jgi:hypothetical protein